MISTTDIVTPRFQLAVLAALLCQVLQSVAMPTIVSAAEQETQRRHSLIHRSAVESGTLPATTQGTIIQPPGAEPPRSTSPIEPPKPSASLPTPPFPHHRTLTKHPAIATITAPATAPQTVPGAPTSGIATGHVTPTADTAKGTVPPATVPTTKSAATPLAGVTSTGAVAVAPSSPPSSTSSASSHSLASAGSSSASSSSGSRSALNLIKNSSIAALLQAPTPVVTTPPSSSPPSTPPSTPPTPPPSPSTGSLTLTWAANGEPDLAGYKIYVGTASGTYNFSGSPFVIGKVTSYTVANLPIGQTYFIAMSAYDSAGNESSLSAEVNKSLF